MIDTKGIKIKQVLEIIYDYGGIDGNHHKQWVLDQIVRILAEDYKEWVANYKNGEDGADTYDWGEGISP